MVRVGILDLFLMCEESIQSSITKYRLAVGFFVDAVIKLSKVCLSSYLSESCYHG